MTLGVQLLETTADSFKNAPLHADALDVLSTVYIQRGLPDDLDAAERHATEGLAIRVAAHGAKSLEAASVYTVLALAQLKLGRQVPCTTASKRSARQAWKLGTCQVSHYAL